MTQVNMLEAKTDLSKLVRLLESREEDTILLARNGKPIVKMTLIESDTPTRRIGVAKGAFTCPDEFDQWDEDVKELFGGYL